MTQGEEARPTAVPGGGIGPEEALKVSEALEEVIASAWDGVSPDDPIAQPLPPDAYDGAWPRRDGERRVDWTRYAPLPKSDVYHRGALVDEAARRQLQKTPAAQRAKVPRHARRGSARRGDLPPPGGVHLRRQEGSMPLIHAVFRRRLRLSSISHNPL